MTGIEPGSRAWEARGLESDDFQIDEILVSPEGPVRPTNNLKITVRGRVIPLLGLQLETKPDLMSPGSCRQGDSGGLVGGRNGRRASGYQGVGAGQAFQRCRGLPSRVVGDGLCFGRDRLQ